ARETRKPTGAPCGGRHVLCAGRGRDGPQGGVHRREGDRAPAPAAGLPARDGPVPADDLDLPQVRAVAADRLLRPGHPADAGRLRDLVLGAGLLYEDETGRAGSLGRIVVLTHHPYTPATPPPPPPFSPHSPPPP